MKLIKYLLPRWDKYILINEDGKELVSSECAWNADEKIREKVIASLYERLAAKQAKVI